MAGLFGVGREISDLITVLQGWRVKGMFPESNAIFGGAGIASGRCPLQKGGLGGGGSGWNCGEFSVPRI